MQFSSFFHSTRLKYIIKKDWIFKDFFPVCHAIFLLFPFPQQQTPNPREIFLMQFSFPLRKLLVFLTKKDAFLRPFPSFLMQFFSFFLSPTAGGPDKILWSYITQKFRFYVLLKTKLNNSIKFFYSNNIGGGCPPINHLWGGGQWPPDSPAPSRRPWSKANNTLYKNI